MNSEKGIMKFLKYILGILKNMFNPRVSFFALVSPDCTIDRRATIYRWAKIKRETKVGAYTYVSHDSVLDNTTMGRFCSIADHCRIGMPSHDAQMISTSPVFTLRHNAARTKWAREDFADYESQPVTIGNDVWIASHVLVVGGITIGDGAIVAAGAVVTKDVPPYAIVGGVPAKIIRYRFAPETIALLEKAQWWNLPEETLRDNHDLFQVSSEEQVKEAIRVLMAKSAINLVNSEK